VHKPAHTPLSLILGLLGFLWLSACGTSADSNAGGASSGSNSGSGGPSSSADASGRQGTGSSSGPGGGSSRAGSGTGGADSGSGNGGSGSGDGGGPGEGGPSGGGDSWLSIPSPPDATGNFPFPQDRRSARCAYPTTISHTRIQTAFLQWLSTMVTAAGTGGNERVQDPGNGSQTTSEGMAYGMLITVYMASKAHFDKLWAFAQAHMESGLMSWHVDANGNTLDPHSASDADEDMAWALVMAEKQWPSGGYLAAAQALIGNIKSQDINGSNNVKDGDYMSNSSHPDYAAPNYYNAFASVSGDMGWGAVLGAEYSQLSGAQNASTGLIPDAIGGNTFGFDACRAPWRVGLDYCWNGSPSAKSFLSPMVAYFMQVSQGGASVTGIKIPVPLTGGTGQYNTGAITGPAAIAAMMSSSNQALIDNSWSYSYSLVMSASNPGNPNYFSSTVGLISLLALSGNFIDYTNPP
jgi:endo-1,4-beta-D-glucanase Y